MNENAKKWVAALRSGEFEQGDGVLCHNGRYCCLGVACVVYQRETEDKFPTLQGHTVLYGDLGKVRKWLGIQSWIGCFRTHSKDYSLAKLNDSGFTFDQIADIIESEPEGLFES